MKKEGEMLKKRSVMSIIMLIFSALLLAGCGSTTDTDQSQYLTTINHAYMVTADEAYQWNNYKDQFGATYSGNPSWKSYMTFLEQSLKAYGVQDIVKNSFTYNRWFTTDWPGDGKWSLVSNGQPINVASYGAYSGSTPTAGVTAPLVYYDYTPTAPLPDVAGKIVVVTMPPFTTTDPLPTAFLTYGTSDADYMSDIDTIPPIGKLVPSSTLVAGTTFYYIGQSSAIISKLRSTTAAGLVIVWPSAYDTVAGYYTFGVPAPYAVPTLYLGRVEGAKVVADAQAGKTATLKLLAETTPTDTYQFVGYLPGKNYGTPQDEQIMMKTHSDGPSLNQENGGLGLLGIVKYFSQIPQSVRPRTLVINITNVHFINGAVVPADFQDWFVKNPNLAKPVVGSIATEMMGQQEWREKGEVYEPSGLPEMGFLWVRNNQYLVDLAIKAVKDNGWSRCEVKSNERPGAYKGIGQGTWFGEGSPGSFTRYGLNVPGFSMMQTTGAYWQTTGRINRFDRDGFVKQVATFCQLTGELMVANLTTVDPVWGILKTTIGTPAAIANSSPAVPFTPDTAFVTPTSAATQRVTLVGEVDAIFNNVKAGNYATVKQQLTTLKADVTGWINEPNKATINTLIDGAAAKIQAKL
jgi:hypothetical protein